MRVGTSESWATRDAGDPVARPGNKICRGHSCVFGQIYSDLLRIGQDRSDRPATSRAERAERGERKERAGGAGDGVFGAHDSSFWLQDSRGGWTNTVQPSKKFEIFLAGGRKARTVIERALRPHAKAAKDAT